MVELIRTLLSNGKRKPVSANITTKDGERGQVTSVRTNTQGRILITVSLEDWDVKKDRACSRVVRDLGIRKFAPAVLDDIARCLLENQ